jgi:dolichyl-phosphate-mannose-protein mannosyltransferase
MTSVVLTDTEHPEPGDVDPDEPAGSGATRTPVPDIVRRRLGRPAWPSGTFWMAAMFVTTIAAALRLIRLSHPHETIFDELYYANEAHDLLGHGVEWNPDDNTPQYVVHPPLGKWMIAVGEHFFGFNSFGWRISATVIGTLSILLVILIAQRLFRSTLLACAAGLLMTLDGMEFVLSRVALLDIFLMFWIVVAFGFLVLDREQRRARWLRHLESGADPSKPGRAGRPPFAVPWFRLAAGVSLGLACGVKWSGVWFLPLFALLILLWEIGARRSAGVKHPWRDAFLDEIGWISLFVVLGFFAYLSTWAGWFASDDGYFRHWYADSHGLTHDRPFDWFINLLHYHQEAYRFHTTLTTKHQYQSWPWQWLLLGRPVAFYWTPNDSCGAGSCASEILLLGTPLLWWSFIPALVGLAWAGIARRDWRALAIGLCAAAGIVPWFWSELDQRTMFYFYALPSEPFLILAVVYVLGAIMGPSKQEQPAGSDRRLIGALVFGAYVLLVAACFAYFYPIYTGGNLTYTEWFARMWLGNRWV